MTRSVTTTLSALLAGACITLSVAGCAVKEETVALPSYRDWTKLDAKQIANAKPAPEPKLLPVTHFSAGRLFEKQGRYNQAIEQYRKAVQLNTRFAAAYNRLGLCYMKLGRYADAAAALTKGVAVQPKSAYLRNNLGFAYLIQRDLPRAEKCFREALQIKPAFARARMNLALTLVYQQRAQEALSHLMMLSAEHVAWYNLGQMLLAADKPAEAKEAFAKALECKADFPPAERGLQKALARLPKPAPAEQAPPVPAEPAVAEAAQAPATQPSAEAQASREQPPQSIEDATAAAADREQESPAPEDRRQQAPAAESSASAQAASQGTGEVYWLRPPWTVWLEGFDRLMKVDVASLSQDDLLDVLAQWQKALDELGRLAGVPTTATALAE